MLTARIIMFSLVCIISAVCIFIYKKIEPEKFKFYLIYVICLIGVTVLLYRPWEFFG